MVRGFAEGASRRVESLRPLRSLAKLVDDFQRAASSIPDSAISKGLARTEGIREVGAVCRDGRIWIDAVSESGESFKLSIAPLPPRFAPRGAKELAFEVQPPEASERALARELVGVVAAMVAHTLWAPLLGRTDSSALSAIAERDDAAVRVDLRSVPAVKQAQARGLGAMFDVLELRYLRVDDGRLSMSLKLPGLFAPHP